MWVIGWILTMALSASAEESSDKAQVLYIFVQVDESPGADDLVHHIFSQIQNFVDEREGARVHVREAMIFGYDGENFGEVDVEQVVARVRRILEAGEVYDETHYTLGQGAWLGLSFRSQEELHEALARRHGGRAEPMSDQDLMKECEAVFLAPVRN